MNIRLQKNFRTGLCFVLGLSLIWAALSKIASVQDFYAMILSYRLPAPKLILQGVAITLPWLELFCGLMLLTRFWMETGLVCTIALLLTFVLVTGQAWFRGLDISCGCFNLAVFGIGGSTANLLEKYFESVGFAFFRALLLAAAAIYVLRHETRTRLAD